MKPIQKMQTYTLFNTRNGFLDTDTIEWLDKTPKPTSVDIEPVKIQVFSQMLKNYSTYNEIPLQEFWEFLMELMLIFSDLKEPPEDVSGVHEELQGIKVVLLWWIYTEGHLTQVRGLDYTFLNTDRMGVNNLFRTKACHVWGIIESRSNLLPLMYKASAGSLRNRSKPEEVDELFKMIRDSCLGDSDELVVYCMDYIKKRVITDHHIKLANVTRLVYDSNSSTDESPLEAWRVLFPRFFDDSGKSFQTFSAAFLNFTILFFMEDYLQLNMDHIQIIPFTFPKFVVKGSDGSVAEDVLYFYGIDFFKERANVIRRLSETS